ncbi:MAG: Adenylate cyclase [uncultured bacterium (gcode 4)]|uniref:Adenylate cyclase n=1 Tax=uncultured bacterium (gcode 4) TaxID=1234023 RepID=K2GHQ2_9BACT|nr:MAG: Adenylate cyclase [uncultured bacterium (gcode 4)]
MQTTHWEDTKNIEIERKFLLSRIPEFMRVQPSKEITQWYLPSFRIRQIWENYRLTIKRGKWVVRQEFEIDITEQEFKHFWALGKDESLSKTRFYLESGWYEFEADEYHNNLSWLFTVEVEFSNEDEAMAFVPPDWFWEEVTDDEEFSNRSLSSNWITEMMKRKIENQDADVSSETIKLGLSDWVKWIVRWTENLVKKAKGIKPVFIWISWWSNSWKTSKVTNEVISILEESWIKVIKISMDDFCYWPTYLKKMMEKTWELNFDAPYSYDLELWKKKLKDIAQWKDVRIPLYDFKDDPREDAQEVQKSQVYLLEWLYTFYDDELKWICDLRAFVQVSSHGRVVRRLTRDAWGSVAEPWRTRQSHLDVLEQILSTVEPMDKQYIQPQIKNSHIIIDNDHNPEIESVNIRNADSQVKFQIENLPIDKLCDWLEVLGFAKWETLEERDTYYNHDSKELILNWEVFRIRHSKKQNDTISEIFPVLTYKYSHLTDTHREESILSFEINDKVIGLLDKEYAKVWEIKKTRTYFRKWNISITIDSSVEARLNQNAPIGLWDFLEIRGFKGADELNDYSKLISGLIMKQNSWLSSSYIKMLFAD